uniref:Protein kinase domain-containing protein n=1 Tax=Oryza glumipatula TaxID=40148 RepID=A0A0E0B260_9ORYZ
MADKLGQAASVMQVTGVDAFGLVSMIVQAAHTARRNRDLCRQLAQHVQIVGGLLRKLQIPELRRQPETRRPLEQLDDALFRAYKLVRSCSQQQESRSQLYQMLKGADVACKLRAALEEIDRYIQLIPMITLVAAIAARREYLINSVLHNNKTFRPRLSPQGVTECTLSLKAVRPAVNGTVEESQAAGPRRFCYSELSRATRGFSNSEKLGADSNGSVYRGFLRDLLRDQGLHVAIRRVLNTSRYGMTSIGEVTAIHRLRHPKLVRLLGWCHEEKELLLAYEFMVNRSLHDHLHKVQNIALPWTIRYKIILDLGTALHHCHKGGEPQLVHGDINPRNVMLDSSFSVKLGDFCLTRLIEHCRSPSESRMCCGTNATEYADLHRLITGQVMPWSDVYSFGVVLLEVASGRRPFRPYGEESLVGWVWQMYRRNDLLDAADQRLGGDFDSREMERMLLVGLWCAHPDYGLRPSIGQAMSVLLTDEPLPEPLPPLMLPCDSLDNNRCIVSSTKTN